MKASAFWASVPPDGSAPLGRLVHLFERLGIRRRVIGGQVVDAHLEPFVSLDLDVVVAAEQVPPLLAEPSASGGPTFPHGVDASSEGRTSASRSRPTRATPGSWLAPSLARSWV